MEATMWGLRVYGYIGLQFAAKRVMQTDCVDR